MPILPEQCFVGLRQNVAVRLITRTMLDNMFPGLYGGLRGTRTTVWLVEFHALVIRTDVAVTRQSLGTTGPQLARGVEESGSRVNADRIAEGSNVPIHISMESEMHSRGEVGRRKVSNTMVPVGGIDPLSLRFQPR